MENVPGCVGYVYGGEKFALSAAGWAFSNGKDIFFPSSFISTCFSISMLYLFIAKTLQRGTTVTTPTRPPHPHPLRHRDRDLLQSNQRSIEIAASGVMANVIMAAAASAKETATQIQVVLEISNASKGKRTSMYLVVAVVVDMVRFS